MSIRTLFQSVKKHLLAALHRPTTQTDDGVYLLCTEVPERGVLMGEITSETSASKFLLALVPQSVITEMLERNEIADRFTLLQPEKEKP